MAAIAMIPAKASNVTTYIPGEITHGDEAPGHTGEAKRGSAAAKKPRSPRADAHHPANSRRAINQATMLTPKNHNAAVVSAEFAEPTP